MIRPLLYLAVVLSLASACAVAPKKVVAKYDKDGVHFSYNSTWKIASDAPIEDKPDMRSIELHGPHNAILILICEPPDTSQTLKDFADAVAKQRVSAIKSESKVGPVTTAETDIGTSEPASAGVGGKRLKGIQQHFQINLLGQPVPHDAEFYLLETDRYRVMLMMQVSTSYLEITRPDWQVILDSVKVDALDVQK